jgi:ClpX C4-type zinc finger protein
MNETEVRAIGVAEPGDTRCSFCGKDPSEVRTIVTAKTSFICDECIGLCLDILAEEAGHTTSNRPESPEEEEARRELGELARRLAGENDEARRRELGKLARGLAEECWREQGLPKVIGQLAMTLANALDPKCHADLP